METRLFLKEQFEICTNLAQASKSRRSNFAIEATPVTMHMPIDYSKWDSLALSDSGEEGEAVGSEQDSGHSPPTMTVVAPDRIQDVDKTLELRAAAIENEARHDELAAEMAENNQVLICTGPPGRGKSFVADLCIRRAQISGARICYALPTGQLAAKAREKHVNIEIDTRHGAFLLHRPLTEAIALLSLYDLCVVDEIFQLTVEHFERHHAMFEAAGRQLCLVLLGDPTQLPNVEGGPPDNSPKWQFAQKINLTQVHRFAGRHLE